MHIGSVINILRIVQDQSITVCSTLAGQGPIHQAIHDNSALWVIPGNFLFFSLIPLEADKQVVYYT